MLNKLHVDKIVSHVDINMLYILHVESHKCDIIDNFLLVWEFLSCYIFLAYQYNYGACCIIFLHVDKSSLTMHTGGRNKQLEFSQIKPP